MNRFNLSHLTAIIRSRLSWVRTAVQAGALGVVISQTANAAYFAMPAATDSLIDNSPDGRPVYIKARQEDSLIDIAVENLLGQEEIVRANKNVDRWLPKAGTEIRIPNSYLLPDAPRKGIVINLPEFRLYYYLPDGQKVISYSVGIGRMDWNTPLGLTKVVAKVKNPTWTPPPSIRAEHLAKGDVLPEVWPAGPDNPLGLFAFRLAVSGYLLHSTNKPQGIGMQVSHGCMRLYPKDVEELFSILPVGTQVNIVNQPVKIGWSNGSLYVESHPNLDGEQTSYQQRLQLASALISKATVNQPVSVNQAALQSALLESNGIPARISGVGSIDNDPFLAEPPKLDNIDVNDPLTWPSVTETEKPLLHAPPVLTEPAAQPPVTAPVLTAPPAPAVKSPPALTEPPQRKKTVPPLLIEPAQPVKKKIRSVPKAPPKLDESVVPQSTIDEEMRREQQREFKNSPFPLY